MSCFLRKSRACVQGGNLLSFLWNYFDCFGNNFGVVEEVFDVKALEALKESYFRKCNL